MSNTPCELIKTLLAQTKTLHIKLLGDSITHGVGGTGFAQNGAPIATEFSRNPDGYCWAKQFKDYMEKTYNCTVTNNACTGTKIDFILAHFDTLVDAEDDLIICTIGTNNRHRYYKDFPDGMPAREDVGADFYQKIFRLYDRLKAAGKQVIFVANIPATKENEQDGAEYWRVLHMDDINAIYKAAHAKLGFPFISLYDKLSAYCAETNTALEDLLPDGLHPGDRCYDIMFHLLMKEFGLFASFILCPAVRAGHIFLQKTPCPLGKFAII